MELRYTLVVGAKIGNDIQENMVKQDILPDERYIREGFTVIATLLY